ncbi:MAG: hypothetical protein K9K38_07625 [Rhodoferax sp.]|nr:hypothetical protein [Rhodoferax sp.]
MTSKRQSTKVRQPGSDTNSQTTTPPLGTDDLLITIADMHTVVASNMGQVDALARLTMHWLKSPAESASHLDIACRALQQIAGIAQGTADFVHSESEAIDCASEGAVPTCGYSHNARGTA